MVLLSHLEKVWLTIQHSVKSTLQADNEKSTFEICCKSLIQETQLLGQKLAASPIRFSIPVVRVEDREYEVACKAPLT